MESGDRSRRLGHGDRGDLPADTAVLRETHQAFVAADQSRLADLIDEQCLESDLQLRLDDAPRTAVVRGAQDPAVGAGCNSSTGGRWPPTSTPSNPRPHWCRKWRRLPAPLNSVIFQVESPDAGQRLDNWLNARLPDYSRSRIQDWIKSGRVRVNGAASRPSHTLRGGETIDVEPAEQAPLRATAEAIPLTVLYEDADLVAIDKPAGMVVHAGAGVHSGTLVNALLHRFADLSGVGGALRPGIVHRLDRFTSGVLLVAKHDAAHRRLAEQFAGREVRKTYLTLVQGEVKALSGRIERPIARDPVHRTRMTARLAEGRAAWSEYRVLRKFAGFTLLEVRIGTGRTHQIRVHLASIKHPVVGDTLYGAAAQPELGRYFLHAHRIEFQQPSTGEEIAVVSPLAPELEAWLGRL